MAISRVQSKSVRQPSVTSLEISFDGDVAAGNSIVVAVGSDDTTGMTVSDNKGNSYSLDKRLVDSRLAEIQHASNVAAGATTITITPGAQADLDVCIIEYDKNLELDQSNSNQTTSATSHPCGSITTTVDDEVIVTASRSVSPYSGTPASGYTELAELARAYFQDRITTSTETTDGAWTSGQNETVASVICSYNEVVGGPSGDLVMVLA